MSPGDKSYFQAESIHKLSCAGDLVSLGLLKLFQYVSLLLLIAKFTVARDFLSSVSIIRDNLSVLLRALYFDMFEYVCAKPGWSSH